MQNSNESKCAVVSFKYSCRSPVCNLRKKRRHKCFQVLRAFKFSGVRKFLSQSRVTASKQLVRRYLNQALRHVCNCRNIPEKYK